MSTCILRQIVLRSGYRVRFLPLIQTACQRGTNIKCTCHQTQNQCYSSENYQQNRHFNTSNVQRNAKVQKSFDTYYAAVIEAHKLDEKLISYKYSQTSDDETERNIEIRRWMFIEAVDIYKQKSETVHHSGLRRGHIEFITQALSRMKDLGVHRDLACYKALIQVFPEDIMVPTTAYQVEFYHYPVQQDKAKDILEQMEENTLIPDQETRDLLEARFGKQTHVIRKVRRMIYWMRKFQNANPYKLPHHLPLDPIKLAILALKKMSVDLENEIKVFKVTDDGEKIFIASAQSPLQREMIKKHSETVPLYVEGGFPIWLRDKRLTHFILKADSDPKLFKYPTKEEQDEEDLEFETIFDSEEPSSLAPMPNVHQQDDGTILGMCITETSTKDSLISWIRCLQEDNPSLDKIPIVFALKQAEEGVIMPVNEEKSSEHQTQPGQ